MFYKEIKTSDRDVLIPVYDFINQEISYFIVWHKGNFYPIKNIDNYKFNYCLFKRYLLKFDSEKFKDIIDIETLIYFYKADSKKYKQYVLGFNGFYDALLELNTILSESTMIRIFKAYEDLFEFDDSNKSEVGFNFWNNDVNQAVSVLSGNVLKYKNKNYIVDYSPLFTKTKRITGISSIDVNRISDDNMLKYNPELERFDFNAYIPTVIAEIANYDYPNVDFYDFLGGVLSNSKKKYRNIDREKVKKLVFYLMFSDMRDNSCMFFEKVSDIKRKLSNGDDVFLMSGKKVNKEMYPNSFTYLSHQAETEKTVNIINFLHLNGVDVKFLHYDAFFLDKDVMTDKLVNMIFDKFKMRLKK